MKSLIRFAIIISFFGILLLSFQRIGNSAPQGLTLTVTEPADRSYTNQTKVTVAGNVNTEGATVTANGADLPVAADNTFRGQIPLPNEGPNTIEVRATVGAKSVVSVTRTVFRDTIAPTILISQPTDGAIIDADQVELRGSAADASGFTITVNNTPAKIVGGKDALWFVTMPLVGGTNLFRVKAVDAAGNFTELTRAITRKVGTPLLSLSVFEPEEGIFTNTNQITVSGTATSTQVFPFKVTINGTPVSVAANGQFSGQVTLTEGSNTIQIVASNPSYRAESTRHVTLDTNKPVITNVTPADNTEIAGATVDIHGTVTDATPVTVTLNNEKQGEVTPTPTGATFVIRNVPIYEFSNYLGIAVLDAAHNLGYYSFNLNGKDKTPPKVPILFPVLSPTRLAYQTIEGIAEPGSKVTVSGGVTTVIVDANPTSGLFTAPIDLAVGANALRVTARDAGGNLSPAASMTIVSNPGLPPAPAGQAWQINSASGNAQRGLIDAELPRPLVALVTDSIGNPVPNVPVVFTVMQGGGKFIGSTTTTFTVSTNAQGYALARYQCGSDAGHPIIHPPAVFQMVRADFAGNSSSPAVFMAQGFNASTTGVTAVSGEVLDQNLRALPNVLVRLSGQQTHTGSDGTFTLSQVPSGPHQLLEIIGRDQVALPGRWPNITFDIDVLPGIDNRTGRPFFLPKVNDGINLPLDANNNVTQDTSYEITPVGGEAPVRVTAKAGTHITFPPDVSDRRLSVTRIPVNRIPMALEDGRATNLYVSVQPSGAIFDPPLEVTFPNLDRQPANTQVLLMSFDHDAGRYIRVGTGRVSVDAKTVKSEAGSGIRVGAWHGFPPVAPFPETDGTGGDPNGPADCDAWFCGVPAVPLGDGLYRARVPSSYGTCKFEARCKCQCQCASCPGKPVSIEKFQAQSTPCDTNRIVMDPIAGIIGSGGVVSGTTATTELTTEVLAGHRITLQSYSFNKTYFWSWSGPQLMTDYMVEKNAGGPIFLEENARIKRSISFYFPFPGKYYVNCDVTSSGRTCRATATFIVYKPEWEMSASANTVKVGYYPKPPIPGNKQFDYLTFGAIPNGVPDCDQGIRFSLNYQTINSLPTSFNKNSFGYEFLQIVKNIKVVAERTDKSILDIQDTNLLDSNVGKWFIADPHRKCDAKVGFSDERSDSPAFLFFPGGPFIDFHTIQKFSMYVFFQPGPGHGWIPLRRVNWEWEGRAIIRDGNWVLLFGDPLKQAALADENITDINHFPKWNEWSNNFLLRVK